MVTLNDYLYSGDTVLRILQKYKKDLHEDAIAHHNEIDLVHCNFLLQIEELLEHNDFLTAQSQKLREFYNYMVGEYPYLSFTFKGRIKSLIRAEEKFNGYIVEFIYDYYTKNKCYPSISELKNRLNCFRDLIAYRIVISVPRCHLAHPEDRKTEEIDHIYKIANILPEFLEERGFTVEPTGGIGASSSPLLSDSQTDIVLCTLLFMITAPDATWKCSFAPRKWMISRRSVPPIISVMKRSRNTTAQEEELSQRANACILTRLMSAA